VKETFRGLFNNFTEAHCSTAFWSSSSLRPIL